MNNASRIQKLFNKKNSKARIAYLTAGGQSINDTLQAIKILINNGVNLLEIGVPFSDPIADGPIIQKASQRALLKGTTMEDILELVKQIRKFSEIPIVLFSYLNPILAAIDSDFFLRAKKAGVDGLLVVDCPLEESKNIYDACLEYNIDLIYVIAPSTSIARIKAVNKYGKGFYYYACQKGITGLRNELPSDLANKILTIKSLVDLPVVVGFGVSNAKMVKRILDFADGVVIGSLFVEALEKKSMDFARLVQEVYGEY